MPAIVKVRSITYAGIVVQCLNRCQFGILLETTTSDLKLVFNWVFEVNLCYALFFGPGPPASASTPCTCPGIRPERLAVCELHVLATRKVATTRTMTTRTMTTMRMMMLILVEDHEFVTLTATWQWR